MIPYLDDNHSLSFFEDDQNFITLREPQNNEIVNNINIFFDLNENDFNKESQNLDNSCSFIKSYTASNLYKYNTNWESSLKKNNYCLPKKEYNQEDESNHNYISLEDIQNNNLTEFDNKIIKNKSIEDAEFKLCNRKRKRENDSIVLFKNEKEAAGDKTKRRRKVNTNNKEYYKMEHNENPEVYINKKN